MKSAYNRVTEVCITSSSSRYYPTIPIGMATDEGKAKGKMKSRRELCSPGSPQEVPERGKETSVSTVREDFLYSDMEILNFRLALTQRSVESLWG